MDNIVDHGQINNNNEVDFIEYIKKMAVGSFHMIRNYDHRHRRVVYGYRLHFIFLLSVMITVCFLPMWLYEVVYIISLYEHLVNMTACWDAMDYNLTPMSYQLHSDHLVLRTNLNWHFLCFAESKLLESSEYKMFLLLLCCCTLQSSTREALWKYIIVITLNFKKFNKKEFYGVLWEYIMSFFWEDRNVQAASSIVVDKFNPLCICTSHCDLNCCFSSSPASSSTLSVIDSPNLDVTEGAAVPVRRHFHSNIGRTGYIVFSSDLARFSGTFRYPLPKKKAEADRIGHCRNGLVFTMYHGNKEFAVKKVMYRPEEIKVYSQLCHPNITDLVAVLIGKEHKRHKDKYHAYYFMPKVGVNFKNVLSANQHDCLKYLKASLVDDDWALVLLNVKHILNKDRRSNLDPMQQIAEIENNEQPDIPNKERKHFPHNINKIGHIFTSNLDCFSGSIQYPLPNKKAAASRLGYGENAIVFVIFHAGKEFAVKKTLYRPEKLKNHSQLCHPNIINLDAVLIGEKHEYQNNHYIYCFMPKMDMNLSNVLSTIEHGCLKHMKMELVTYTGHQELWKLVLINVKHVLKSVLKALDYMHSQGLVHRDIKASNILIKMTCQCTDVLYCNCQRRKFLVQIGDFDSSVTVPCYQPQREEHQMIRYASVLPLGTMGYRAPEVSMHLVLSGPYEVLYTTSVDIWSFGCLLLTIFIGKSEPLKQRGDVSYLWKQLQDPLLLYELNQNIKEVQRYYFNTPGLCALVEKCLEVLPHCRPTAKQSLQSDFFTYS